MVRWIAAWSLAAVAILAIARGVVVPRQESWMLVGASSDESVFVAHYAVGNTGVFANQLTTRVTLLRDDGSPLAHRSIAGPARLDGDGVHETLDHFERGSNGWSWRVAGDSLRSRGTVSTTSAPCPDAPAKMIGFVHIPDDVGTKGEAVRVLGPAAVVRTLAEGNVSGGALYAFSQRGVLGLDPLATCPGFLSVDGAAEAGPPPWIPPDPEDEFELNFGGHRLRVRLGRRELEELPVATTLLPERWLASAVGYHLPTLRLVRARVRVDDLPAWTGVLILRAH